MTKYYVYCEAHGRIGGKYENPNDASRKRKEHLRGVSGPHGKVDVIEEYSSEKYGQQVKSLRKFRK